MIAVTGAEGLLGKFILQELAQRGLEVVGLSRRPVLPVHQPESRVTWRRADILDPLSLMDALEHVDVVVHAAAVVSFLSRDRELIFRTNVEGTRHVVNACLEKGVRRIVHVSSVAALGRLKGNHEISEESRWVDSALNSDYGESKYLAELEVFRGLEEGLDADVINPSLILAPAELTRSSAKLFKYVADQNRFFADGLFNYVDVRDVATVVHLLLNQPASGSRYIVSAGKISIREMMEQIAQRLRVRPPTIEVPSPLLGVVARMEYFRSWITGSEPLISDQTVRMAKDLFYYKNTKLTRDLNFRFLTLESSLDWCCEHYRKAITTNN